MSIVTQSIQIEWSNWSDVCDILGYKFFMNGIYLDDETLVELPEGHTSNTIGCKFRDLKGEVVIIRENEYIVKVSNKYFEKNSKKEREQVLDIYQYVPRKILIEKSKKWH